jgi:hypothetical protein
MMKHLVPPLAAAPMIAILLVGACAHQPAPAPAPEPAAAASPAAGAGALGPEAAGKLHGYLFKLSCGELQDSRSCKLSPEQEKSRLDVVLAGDPGKVYDLRLRVRGLVEPRRYTGGALADPANPWLYVGGAPDPLKKGGGHAYNIYQLSVSDPKQDFYLNRDTADYLGGGYQPSHTIYKIDYPVTLKVRGGATISVITDDLARSGMINNADKQVVEGLPPGLITQPWDGQFFYLEVESITPAG